MIWNASFQVFLRNGYIVHCLEYVVRDRKNSQVCLVFLKMTWSTEVKAEIFYAHNGKIYAKSLQIELEIALISPQWSSSRCYQELHAEKKNNLGHSVTLQQQKHSSLSLSQKTTGSPSPVILRTVLPQLERTELTCEQWSRHTWARLYGHHHA